MTSSYRLEFLKEFLKSPRVVGAWGPSSTQLAAKMVERIDLDSAEIVVEYGPGSGALTEAILNSIGEQCIFVAIERNSAMARMLRHRFPTIRVFEESAEHVDRLCDRENICPVDCIVSGLPWAVFEDKLQDSILESTAKVLRKGGWFVTFAYLQGLMLPAAKRFRKKLGGYFEHVERSKVIWRNFPPAVVYRCRR